jgi:hypothetical protein
VALVRKRTIPTKRPPLSAKQCRLLRVEGVTWSAQRIPTAVNLGFLDRSRFFKQLLSCDHEAEWTPFQTPYLSENLVGPGIEPGPTGSVARNSDHYTTEAVNIFTHISKRLSSAIILSRLGVTIRRGMDWILGLFTTLTNNS